MRLLIATALALLVFQPVSAAECTPSTSRADVDVAGLYYVFDDADICRQTDLCIFSYWVYEESNGIPGAQRGDEHVDDTCGGLIPADRVAL